jgi:hypothetical protein
MQSSPWKKSYPGHEGTSSHGSKALHLVSNIASQLINMIYTPAAGTVVKP